MCRSLHHQLDAEPNIPLCRGNNVPWTAAVGTFRRNSRHAASTLPGRLAISPVVDHVDVIGPPAPPNTDLSLLKSIDSNRGPRQAGRILSRSGTETERAVGPEDRRHDFRQLAARHGNDPGFAAYHARAAGRHYTPDGHKRDVHADGAHRYETSPSSVKVNFGRLIDGAFGLIQFDVPIAPGLYPLTNSHQCRDADPTLTTCVPGWPETSNPALFRVSRQRIDHY